MFQKIDTVGKSLKNELCVWNSDQCFERFLPGVDFLERVFLFFTAQQQSALEES